MPATALRTPGITFSVVPPPTPQTLPRMDIAGFVGFASSGPIDTPVPIEDPAAFAAMFGPDVVIARDEGLGADVFAFLGPAVRSFFANGGLRCWVARVARGAQTSVMPVPGLVTRRADGSLIPASVAARSAGSWADELAVSAALTTEPVSVSQACLLVAEPSIAVPATSDIAAGDMIRVTSGEGAAIVVIVDGEDSPTSPPGSGRNLAVDPQSILFVRDAVAGAAGMPAPNAQGVASMPWASGVTVAARLLSIGESSVTFAVDGGLTPSPGDYILVRQLLGPRGEDLWLSVDEVDADPSSDPETVSGLIVQGAGQFVSQDAVSSAAWFDGQPSYAERLTFDLLAQQPGQAIMQLPGLGFALRHPGWVGLLPSDEQLCAPVPPSSASAVLDVVWGDQHTLFLWDANGTPALWSQLCAPRFPLAAAIADGLPLMGPVSYPLAMPVIEAQWVTPAAPVAPELVRNGLATFDSTLFIDDGLRGDVTSELLDDADRLAFTGLAPRPLHGLHALLYNDEVTLICVPDACQRGWSLEAPSQPGALPPSPPFVRPPAHGAFHECAAQQLDAPVLYRPTPGSGPAASPPIPLDGDVFTLSWSAVGVPGATYVLQQSAGPAFVQVTTYYQGPATQVTVHALDAGLQPGAGRCFRVRVFAGDSQSNWSNSVQVVGGPAQRAVQTRVAQYDSTTLIDVHRALLRAAAARGDVFAVLALPGHYAEQQTLAHVDELQAMVSPPPTADHTLASVPPLNAGEDATLSFGALYHPWPAAVQTDGTTISLPPDGPAVGILAARAASVGAWISPGNIPLANVVALAPSLDPRRVTPGAVAAVNVLSQTPSGFVALSAWTVSSDPQLTDISVRRLLCELRRSALLLGPRYVFEPNDPSLVNTIRRDFESLLAQLYTGGAFAGSTTAQSYFLTVTTDADPASGLDPAQVVVEIGVAPSLPLRFLTVRLTLEPGAVAQVGGS